MGARLGAYKATVLGALGNPSEETLTSDNLLGAINDSYFEVLRLFEHRELKREATFTTTSGTKEQALPADYWWMRMVKDETNDLVLDWRSLGFIQEDETGATSQPEWWVTEDENIVLHPTPDGAYSIRWWYVMRPAVLAAVNDKDVLGPEWTEIIRKGATYRAFEDMGEYDRATHVFNRQRVLLNRITETEVLERATGIEVAGPLEASNKPRV